LVLHHILCDFAYVFEELVSGANRVGFWFASGKCCGYGYFALPDSGLDLELAVFAYPPH